MHPAYFETRFLVGLPERPLPDPGVILSAYATTGSTWPRAVNHDADTRLTAHLHRLGLAPLHRLIGYSPTTGHAEPSWLVALDRERGASIGGLFRQDAIYLVENGLLAVVPCTNPGCVHDVAPFAERLDWLPAEAFAARLAAC